jgi:hypothetical protein
MQKYLHRWMYTYYTDFQKRKFVLKRQCQEIPSTDYDHACARFLNIFVTSVIQFDMYVEPSFGKVGQLAC